MHYIILTGGFKVIQIRCIFSPVGFDGASSRIFLYGQLFSFSSQHQVEVDGIKVFAPAPDIDMFVLKRHLRGNKRVGGIFELTDVREAVELVPQFGRKMDPALNANTSLELANSFYLNNFADKEAFHAILSYQ